MAGHKGVITSIQHGSDGVNTYVLLSKKAIPFKAQIELQLLDKVEIPKSDDEERVFTISEVKVGSKCKKGDYDKAIEKLVKSVKIDSRAPKKIFPKEIEASIFKDMKAAVGIVLKAVLSGAPVSVRFHNDGDGAICGIAFYRAVSKALEGRSESRRGIVWHMQRGIAYDQNSLSEDYSYFSNYKSVEKPVTVILDFATCEESEKGIKESSTISDVVWMDHHPKYEGFESYKYATCINPWFYGLGSDVTAGMLACAFASMIKGVNVSDIVNASLISDQSKYADREDQHGVKVAEVLDFVTGSRVGIPDIQKPREITPKFLDSIVSDWETLQIAFNYSNSHVMEGLRLGIRHSKKYQGKGAQIYLLDFDRISESEYSDLLPGRFASRLQELLVSESGGKPVVTVVFYGNGISVRSGTRSETGENLLELISRVKKSADQTISGGGHHGAVSIRAERGKLEEVIRLVLIELGANL
jgi:RecJ-like exonuclease